MFEEWVCEVVGLRNGFAEWVCRSGGFDVWVRWSGGFVGMGLRNGFSRFQGWVWWDATKSG